MVQSIKSELKSFFNVKRPLRTCTLVAVWFIPGGMVLCVILTRIWK